MVSPVSKRTACCECSALTIELDDNAMPRTQKKAKMNIGCGVPRIHN